MWWGKNGEWGGLNFTGARKSSSSGLLTFEGTSLSAEGVKGTWNLTLRPITLEGYVETAVSLSLQATSGNSIVACAYCEEVIVGLAVACSECESYFLCQHCWETECWIPPLEDQIPDEYQEEEQEVEAKHTTEHNVDWFYEPYHIPLKQSTKSAQRILDAVKGTLGPVLDRYNPLVAIEPRILLASLWHGPVSNGAQIEATTVISINPQNYVNGVGLDSKGVYIIVGRVVGDKIYLTQKYRKASSVKIEGSFDGANITGAWDTSFPFTARLAPAKLTDWITVQRKTYELGALISEAWSCNSCANITYGQRASCTQCYDFDMCLLCYMNGTVAESHLSSHEMAFLIQPYDVFGPPFKATNLRTILDLRLQIQTAELSVVPLEERMRNDYDWLLTSGVAGQSQPSAPHAPPVGHAHQHPAHPHHPQAPQPHQGHASHSSQGSSPSLHHSANAPLHHPAADYPISHSSNPSLQHSPHSSSPSLHQSANAALHSSGGFGAPAPAYPQQQYPPYQQYGDYSQGYYQPPAQQGYPPQPYSPQTHQQPYGTQYAHLPNEYPQQAQQGYPPQSYPVPATQPYYSPQTQHAQHYGTQYAQLPHEHSPSYPVQPQTYQPGCESTNRPHSSQHQYTHVYDQTSQPTQPAQPSWQSHAPPIAREGSSPSIPPHSSPAASQPSTTVALVETIAPSGGKQSSKRVTLSSQSVDAFIADLFAKLSLSPKMEESIQFEDAAFRGHYSPLSELRSIGRIPEGIVFRIPSSLTDPSTPPTPTPSPGALARSTSDTSSLSSSNSSQLSHSVINFEIPFEELEFGRVLGKGAFGEVRAGYWRGTEVAIKASIIQDQKERDDFIAEARLMTSLRPHRHVVQVLGICFKSGTNEIYLIMDLMKASLQSEIYDATKRSKLTTLKLREYALGVAAGLQHVAQEGLVHRDVAVRNVLIDAGGFVRISDFGMSRKMNNAGGGETNSNVGPIRWMSPENIASRTYSQKSDVWSYGCLLYECATGQWPYPDEDLLQAALKIMNEAINPGIPAGCDPVLAKLMEMCWKPRPEDRPTFVQIGQYLREHLLD